MGMALFREHILRKTLTLPSHEGMTALDALIAIILGLIEMEREQEMIDRNLVRACVYMLEGLYETEAEHESGKLYLSTFEPKFLATSRQFYREEGVKIVQTMDTGSFCRRVQARLDEERRRCHSTLSQMTLEKIHSVIDDELIRKQLSTTLNRPESGIPFMLDNDRDDELELVYQLNLRIDQKTTLLKDAIQKHIALRGQAINEAAKDIAQATPKPPAEQAPKPDGEGKPAPDKTINQQTAAAIKWVDDVLRLKDKYDVLLDRAFGQNKLVQAAMTKSFSEFINQFLRSSEYLSLFFDENLKKGIKGKTETEVDALLDNGITLLRYVQDKDMFERYYKKHLSRRLLMKRTVSMDAERQMISKMKLEVGNTFTQRIEQMFRDMDLSADLTRSYKDHKKRAELDVNILTSTMWPLEAMGSANFADSGPTTIFPSSVDRVRQGFQKFYLDKHSGRKLTWQANMGTAEIRAHFPKSKGNIKTRELNVSTYAMIILLLFNDLPADASITCAEIQARTNIPMHDLTRNLQSLAVAPKTRVLIKEPMSKDVKPDDRFSFNEAFHSPLTKIKIGVVSNTNRVEDSDERRETEKKNNDTRAGIIEAAIVRIMKYVSDCLPPSRVALPLCTDADSFIQATEEARPHRSCHGSYPAAVIAFRAGRIDGEEAHRELDRARVPGAGREQPSSSVQLPRLMLRLGFESITICYLRIPVLAFSLGCLAAWRWRGSRLLKLHSEGWCARFHEGCSNGTQASLAACMMQQTHSCRLSRDL